MDIQQILTNLPDEALSEGVVEGLLGDLLKCNNFGITEDFSKENDIPAALLPLFQRFSASPKIIISVLGALITSIRNLIFFILTCRIRIRNSTVPEIEHSFLRSYRLAKFHP